MIHSKKVITSQPEHTKKDLKYIKELIEQGILTSIIDKRFSLEEIPQAHEYVESGQKIGHVIVTIK